MVLIIFNLFTSETFLMIANVNKSTPIDPVALFSHYLKELKWYLMT